MCRLAGFPASKGGAKRWRKNLWVVVLGLYLILVGLKGLGVDFPYMETITAILAIAAGVLILLRR